MNKGVKTLALLTVGVLAYTGFRKGIGAKKLEFYPQGIDLSKISLTNWKPNLKIKIVNPSYIAQKVDAVFLNVYFDNTQLGRIQINTPFEIPKLADTDINFPVQLFPAAVGTLAGKIIKGEMPEFSIAGTIASMGATIPIKTKIRS